MNLDDLIGKELTIKLGKDNKIEFIEFNRNKIKFIEFDSITSIAKDPTYAKFVAKYCTMNSDAITLVKGKDYKVE